VLVIDASFAVQALLSRPGLITKEKLAAPRLLWSEVVSALHELRWRGTISDELAQLARARLSNASIHADQPKRLPEWAWEIADELGWAKTYDAEYVALARHRSCPLLTIDVRLSRTAARVVSVVGPSDI